MLFAATPSDEVPTTDPSSGGPPVRQCKNVSFRLANRRTTPQ